MESTTNSSSSDNNSYKNNMLVENIVINVVLGLVAIIVLICVILLLKYRFFNRNVLQEDNKPIDSVQRIPNPLYKIDSNNNVKYEEINNNISIV
jgi:ATP/ADP translocase